MQVMMRMVLLYWPHPKGETGERHPVPGVVTGWRRTVAGRENLHGNSERNGRGTRGRREDEARARGSSQTQAREVARTRPRGQLSLLRSQQCPPPPPQRGGKKKNKEIQDRKP